MTQQRIGPATLKKKALTVFLSLSLLKNMPLLYYYLSRQRAVRSRSHKDKGKEGKITCLWDKIFIALL
jgi:hypothetical protein